MIRIHTYGRYILQLGGLKRDALYFKFGSHGRSEQSRTKKTKREQKRIEENRIEEKRTERNGTETIIYSICSPNAFLHLERKKIKKLITSIVNLGPLYLFHLGLKCPHYISVFYYVPFIILCSEKYIFCVFITYIYILYT